MMLVYLAKSRAEVAPGVGPDTDMFVIGPELGTYGAVPEDIMAYLREQVAKVKTEETRMLGEAQTGMESFLSKVGRQPPVKQEAEPPCSDAGAFGAP